MAATIAVLAAAAPPGKLLTVTSLSRDRLPAGTARLRKLVVEGLAGPETVRLSCRGKGCRKRANGTFRKPGTRLGAHQA